jgi:hypothetical protein
MRKQSRIATPPYRPEIGQQLCCAIARRAQLKPQFADTRQPTLTHLRYNLPLLGVGMPNICPHLA